jgi:hypothetical protein
MLAFDTRVENAITSLLALPQGVQIVRPFFVVCLSVDGSISSTTLAETRWLLHYSLSLQGGRISIPELD